MALPAKKRRKKNINYYSSLSRSCGICTLVFFLLILVINVQEYKSIQNKIKEATTYSDTTTTSYIPEQPFNHKQALAFSEKVEEENEDSRDDENDEEEEENDEEAGDENEEGEEETNESKDGDMRSADNTTKIPLDNAIVSKNTSVSPPFTLNTNYTQTTTTTTTKKINSTQFYYCQQRSDRTGSAIWDYFNAHAYAFRINQTWPTAAFGGACGNTPFVQPFLSRQASQLQMLDFLGLLNTQIPMITECPSSSDRITILKPADYHETDGIRQGLEAFTVEWTNHMREFLKNEFLTKPNKGPKKQRTIVVHIRRGDVHPCDLYTKNRYLTNKYYLDLIREYTTASGSNNENYKVIVHSQNRSFEPWSDFNSLLPSANDHHQSNVTVDLKLDAPLQEVWSDIIVKADVFLMSKSAFSQAAAVLMNVNSTVVCMPFPHCHSRWIRMNQTRIQEENARLENMFRNQCRNATFSTFNMPIEEKLKHTGENTNVTFLPSSKG